MPLHEGSLMAQKGTTSQKRKKGEEREKSSPARGDSEDGKNLVNARGHISRFKVATVCF